MAEPSSAARRRRNPVLHEWNLPWRGGPDRWLEQRTNLVSGGWHMVPGSQGQTNLALLLTESMPVLGLIGAVG
jgi:hypothetical protein